MISGSYREIGLTPEERKSFEDNGWVSKYIERARSVDPAMTDGAVELIMMVYDIAKEEDPEVGEDRLKACFILAEMSARMRFSLTVEAEDAHRAAMIVFPDP